MDVKFTCIRVDTHVNTEVSASNFEQGHYLDVKFTSIRVDAHVNIEISTLILNKGIIWLSNSLLSELTLRNTEISASNFEQGHYLDVKFTSIRVDAQKYRNQYI